MSRRVIFHDNAVAEILFQLLKRERVKRKIYATRAGLRSDLFDYIEILYNTRRKNGFNDQVPPVVYEQCYQKGG